MSLRRWIERNRNRKKSKKQRKAFIEPLEQRILLSAEALPYEFDLDDGADSNTFETLNLDSGGGLTSSMDIVSVAGSGTPADGDLPSANVRQAIQFTGTGFTEDSQVRFQAINYLGTTYTRDISPSLVAQDGSSMVVVVPDDARTGHVSIVGTPDSVFLQIVPTVVDVDLNSTSFVEGAGFQILGSGFTEGDLTVRFGATEVVDTSASGGPDISYYHAIGAGLDLADNEVIYLQLPAGASTGSITVETAGGTSAALPISLS